MKFISIVFFNPLSSFKHCYKVWSFFDLGFLYLV